VTNTDPACTHPANVTQTHSSMSRIARIADLLGAENRRDARVVPRAAAALRIKPLACGFRYRCGPFVSEFDKPGGPARRASARQRAGNAE
jgi:hypothetical protein